jgi:hypothetical protein
MGGFKIICSCCGSDKIVEKSAINRIGMVGTYEKYGEGMLRKCTDCDNEDFAIFRTWEQKE